MMALTFVLRDGKRRIVEAEAGSTLLQVAHQNGLYEIEGACGGAMACSTCHVIIDPAWYAKLPRASDDETDMLDLAPGVTRFSRLGCQIKVTEALDGLVVQIPG